MRRLLPVLCVGAWLAALGVFVLVGRLEGRWHADDESRGMRKVMTAVGPLSSPSLDAYRRVARIEYLRTTAFDCLLYRRGSDPFALELCFDPAGRLIEAIDRRSGEPRVWSLREDPAAAKIRVDRAVVDGILHRVGALS